MSEFNFYKTMYIYLTFIEQCTYSLFIEVLTKLTYLQFHTPLLTNIYSCSYSNAMLKCVKCNICNYLHKSLLSVSNIVLINIVNYHNVNYDETPRMSS